MDETIELLLRERRKGVPDAIAGTDRVKSRKFTEEDHLEGRN